VSRGAGEEREGGGGEQREADGGVGWRDKQRQTGKEEDGEEGASAWKGGVERRARVAGRQARNMHTGVSHSAPHAANEM